MDEFKVNIDPEMIRKLNENIQRINDAIGNVAEATLIEFQKVASNINEMVSQIVVTPEFKDYADYLQEVRDETTAEIENIHQAAEEVRGHKRR